ncbi:ABC transporter permease [Paenibacillus psychroresistens]|uniref:ABC transporter permease n=1 Tax=Paenibacillus psychroresistens TaxID=1778678 RepID=A0A6B8RS07_9BACL|nr:ABC transporter permease [Paenibacillus psychroresistens]QGQ98146.1 ABC transporter permease [Paenibacillus psychroresistens]
MKAYLSVGKLQFTIGLQYRVAALAGLSTQFFFGFVYIMIFVAFYSQSSDAQPISLQNLVAYMWMQQAFLSFIALWFRDNTIFQMITTGNIAYEMCRPCNIYELWYAKLLAQRVSSALLRCFPIIIVAFFLPQPFRLILPPSPVNFLLFLVTMTLGVFVIVSISMLIYISVFWTMSPIGSILMIAVAGEFFSGMIIPIPLMPTWLQNIVYILPFRLTADFPFRVYSGQIPVDKALWGILIQLVWLAALLVIGKLSMRKALQQVVVQGG